MVRQLSTTASVDNHPPAMSYEEFVAWAGEETRAEWVDGELIILEMQKAIHQRIILFLAELMSHYGRLRDLGEVMVAPFNMRLVPVRSSRQPDIIFVAREHENRMTEDRLEGPADLVVEVIPPDSVVRDKQDKLLEYQQAGVHEYWIVDPRERRKTIEPYVLGDRGVYRPIPPDERGHINSTVISGFWLDPAWLWEVPLPDPDAMLMEIAPDAFFERVRALYEARQVSSKG